MLRLDELENLLHIVQNDGQNTRDYLPQINAYKKEFQDIAQRVDAFEDLLRVINRNLSNLEQHVDTAGEELGYSETGLMGLLKPLFKEQRKLGETVKTNLDGDMNYVPCEVFKAEDYFPDSSSCWGAGEPEGQFI